MLYGLVDTNDNNGNLPIVSKIRQLIKLSEEQAKLPLVLIFMGDKLLLPINSGYLSYEHLRSFIALKFIK